MNKVILVTGTIVGVAYLTELFIAWHSGYIYEQFRFLPTGDGTYWWSYVGMMSCNVLSPRSSGGRDCAATSSSPL